MPQALTLRRLLLATLVCSAAADLRADEPAPQDEQEYLRLYGLFAEALTEVELNYVEPVDRRRLVEAAIRGMVGELDRHSRYLTGREFEKARDRNAPQRDPLGLLLGIDPVGWIVAVGVEPGSAAERAGLRPGDRVVSIGGRPIEDGELTTAEELISAKPQVSVVLQSPDGAVRRTRIEAIRSPRTTVHGFATDEGDGPAWMLPQSEIGYAWLSAFGAATAADLRVALDDATRRDAQGFILDLRDNAGGLLEGAVDVCDLFLSEGEIVSVEGRDDRRRVWKASAEPNDVSTPLVVLVNRYSASASEVTSGCLQDRGRATLVGERTWGKASVQTIIALDGGEAALKLTTAAYRRPSGRSIDRPPSARPTDSWGVEPGADGLAGVDDATRRRLFEARAARTPLPVADDPQIAAAVALLTAPAKNAATNEAPSP
ncbi:Carboxy-terminal processing protease CtpA precursor [Pseudobythopirellula maris]|uniref:Carboxy-terminal processing protease CtpA n=1 Tax=Pseudobythopirellula maris TaxID=2527991 RepID=A0A5C5ZMZ1_9BACT|nr:S41 family peptidase [Pseudobythopirellula maris]TWT88466.1 Carboxy-terminal processing protease CtpA precursor [Pseudobythopirellula maris]